MSYTSLKNKIQNFLENDGADLVFSLDDIISQAEEMVFQRMPNLPCFRHVQTGTLISGTSDYNVMGASALSGSFTAQPRMIRQVCITYGNDKIYLDHRIDSYLRDYWPDSSSTGIPIMYSTKTAFDTGSSGTTITLAPTPNSDLAYQVDYIAPEQGLSSSNTRTWIDTNAPNVLLAAALYESSAFLKAPETLQLYKTQFDEAVNLFVQEMQRNYAAEYNGGI
tara:strand:+ start:314 stop:979 length:666 start_codon:yes stop_codon:yes gene_type:complete